MYRRGELFWVCLDPVIGAETGKTRPAVIVSNDINNEVAATVTVVPVSSNTGKVYPFEVAIPKGAGGIKEASKAKANQIRTVAGGRLVRRIGMLPPDIMARIDEAILLHLGICR